MLKASNKFLSAKVLVEKDTLQKQKQKWGRDINTFKTIERLREILLKA